MEHAGALRFGIVTDVHFQTEDPRAAHRDEADLRHCLEDLGRRGARFLVQLGDLIKGTPEHAPEELRQALGPFREFRGPVRHVIGNHCLQVPAAVLQQAFGLRHPWYSFTEGGVLFLVLDGMEVSLLREPGTEEDRAMLEHFRKTPGYQPWCGAVGSRQKAWLQKELRLAGEQRMPAFVLSHLPLHPATTDERHGILWNHGDIRDILAAAPAVKACISGHYHPGGYSAEGGIHYIVLPAFFARGTQSDDGCFMAELRKRRLVVSSTGGSIFHDVELDEP
ncbi:metallophosphoesterase [Pelodictyon luteolum]|uniref:Calcineurin-like phosphoesterase domain-containing protein n=1 Tax=Chlorobium luteolum (strain DSM 273 / BCRC 81028 / 2530) TaxID=319225 RepID=Q3B1A7_CHLL3|nr:metallophosphoesterase [Pelodictyon luteolum]ABB24874.1 conserved hypothetical protein [Pelodictyon luteolum DSM 273]